MNQQQGKFFVNQSSSMHREGGKDNKPIQDMDHEKVGTAVKPLKKVRLQEQRLPPPGSWYHSLGNTKLPRGICNPQTANLDST